MVSIFIHAPKPYRVNKVMEMYGDTHEEGAKSIARSDASRAAYYENISGKAWGDSRNYSLCIDSSIGVEAAAELICCYVKNIK